MRWREKNLSVLTPRAPFPSATPCGSIIGQFFPFVNRSGQVFCILIVSEKMKCHSTSALAQLLRRRTNERCRGEHTCPNPSVFAPARLLRRSTNERCRGKHICQITIVGKVLRGFLRGAFSKAPLKSGYGAAPRKLRGTGSAPKIAGQRPENRAYCIAKCNTI